MIKNIIGKYAIKPQGDVNRGLCLQIIHAFGHKPTCQEEFISRSGFNTIMFLPDGFWTNWTDEAAKSGGLEIVSGEEFVKNPIKYLPENDA